MAWKKRANKTFLYRSQRVNGRVVTAYVGNSPEIAQTAKAEAERRAAERAASVRYEKIKQQLDTYEELARLLTQATLVLNGYYLHKRQWRKRGTRSKRPTTPPTAPPPSQDLPPTP